MNSEREFDLKRFEYDLTSPLERAKDPGGWRWQRMGTLREVIDGPASPEDWHRAKEEFDQLQYGPDFDEHDDFGY